MWPDKVCGPWLLTPNLAWILMILWFSGRELIWEWETRIPLRRSCFSTRKEGPRYYLVKNLEEICQGK